jgi:lipopolysaccharide export LptBFGC system permease protein LptF
LRAVRSRILDRYLLTEATAAWFAVTFVLLSIMLSTRFTRALAQAAAGNLPKELLFEVAALSSLQYLVILIPFSLMLAIMLALGRLYRDNEIAAMTGCGVGLDGLYRPFLVLGIVLATLTALLAFHVGPWAGRTSDYLVKNAARMIQYNPFEAGHFKEVAGGRVMNWGRYSRRSTKASAAASCFRNPASSGSARTGGAKWCCATVFATRVIPARPRSTSCASANSGPMNRRPTFST